VAENRRRTTEKSVRNSERRRVPAAEKTQARKQQRDKKNKRNRQLAMILTAAAVILFAVVVIFSAVRKNATEISVNDALVCTVKKTNITSEDITNTVTAQLTSEYGANVRINEEIILEDVRAPKKELVTMEYALSQLKQAVTYKVEAAVIIVDNNKVAVMPTVEEAQTVLDSIIAEYIPEDKNIVERGFVESVRVQQDFVDAGEMMAAEEVYTKLTVGSPVTKTYTIATNDTLYKIAANADITVEELLEANPGITLDSVLRVGQDINLTVLEPFLSVKTAENIIFTEKQAKEVEYRQDSSKPSSYKKVTQQGQDGQKEVTTQIIRINGFETEEKVISEKTTVEPITEIIVVGTN